MQKKFLQFVIMLYVRTGCGGDSHDLPMLQRDFCFAVAALSQKKNMRRIY